PTSTLFPYTTLFRSMPLWSNSWAKTGSILICPANSWISVSAGLGFNLQCSSWSLLAIFNFRSTLSFVSPLGYWGRARTELSAPVVENLYFQFGKPAEHFHDPAIFFHGQVHGPLELVLLEIGTRKMVFDRHGVIITGMLLGQFGLGLYPKVVHFQFHLFDQGSHVQTGTSR